MTTRISCKAHTEYIKAHDHVGPKLCVVMQPTFFALVKALWLFLTGQGWCLYHEFTETEVMKQAEDIKHWYIVKSLRGYKRRAK